MAAWLAASVIAAALAIATAPRFVLRRRGARVDAEDVGLPVETVFIDSPSGARLAGWFLPGDSNSGAVLLLHGVTSNRSSHVARIRFLRAAGFATLAVDFQAHGESTGSRITLGALESRDAGAALAYLRARLPGERIGVIGVSLGGAAALIGLAPLAADALILKSVFPDIHSALRNRLTLAFGRLAAISTRPLLALAGATIGFDPAELRPIDRIASFTGAVFVISGRADQKTTLSETRALFGRAREPKFLWEVPGAGHVDLAGFCADAYRERVLAFFRETLRVAD
jgi:fermentation-respiration switch protein FrsA (DUF1100 family)